MFEKLHSRRKSVHRGLLEDEGPDPAWLEDETERRREHDEQFKAVQRATRLAARERMRASERLREVEHAILLASQTAASRTEGSTRKSKKRPALSTSKPPPGVMLEGRAFDKALDLGGTDPAEVHRYLRLVVDAIRKLEVIVDSQYEQSSAKANAFTEDLNKLLVERYEDYPPEDISLLEPSLGSPTAIRKSRQLLNRHRETGKPMLHRTRRGR